MINRKLNLISASALAVCITSAIFAASIPAADLEGHPDWNNFGKSIWITLLVTLPSFIIFLVIGIVAVIKAIRK